MLNRTKHLGDHHRSITILIGGLTRFEVECVVRIWLDGERKEWQKFLQASSSAPVLLKRRYLSPLLLYRTHARFSLVLCVWFISQRVTLPALQCRLGDKPVKIRVFCPQNGTAVLKGLLGGGVTSYRRLIVKSVESAKRRKGQFSVRSFSPKTFRANCSPVLGTCQSIPSSLPPKRDCSSMLTVSIVKRLTTVRVQKKVSNIIFSGSRLSRPDLFPKPP